MIKNIYTNSWYSELEELYIEDPTFSRMDYNTINPENEIKEQIQKFLADEYMDQLEFENILKHEPQN